MDDDERPPPRVIITTNSNTGQLATVQPPKQPPLPPQHVQATSSVLPLKCVIPFTMGMLCCQRKENFIGDLGLLSKFWIHQRGVLILTKVLCYEVFNYSGIHSSFETVALDILYSFLGTFANTCSNCALHISNNWLDIRPSSVFSWCVMYKNLKFNITKVSNNLNFCEL